MQKQLILQFYKYQIKIELLKNNLCVASNINTNLPTNLSRSGKRMN